MIMHLFLFFQIPPVLAAYSYTLFVEASGGLSFNESRRLNKNEKGMQIFIQTDKATYKPSDTGMFSHTCAYKMDGDSHCIDKNLLFQ